MTMGQMNVGFSIKSGDSRIGKQLVMRGLGLMAQDLKISSKDTDGTMLVVEISGHAPMTGPPLHIHPYQDEVIYIVEGLYQVQVGKERYPSNPGDTVFLPKAVPHAFLQLTGTGKMIVTFSPAGKMEDFFKAADLLTSPLKSDEEIVNFFATYDMKVVGPPLKAL
jgi:quercetin dioxygenase-like cupin family protein